jgi:hypothetical protein
MVGELLRGNPAGKDHPVSDALHGRDMLEPRHVVAAADDQISDVGTRPQQTRQCGDDPVVPLVAVARPQA